MRPSPISYGGLNVPPLNKTIKETDEEQFTNMEKHSPLLIEQFKVNPNHSETLDDLEFKHAYYETFLLRNLPSRTYLSHIKKI
jgi:hypothetical protein